SVGAGSPCEGHVTQAKQSEQPGIGVTNPGRVPATGSDQPVDPHHVRKNALVRRSIWGSGGVWPNWYPRPLTVSIATSAGPLFSVLRTRDIRASIALPDLQPWIYGSAASMLDFGTTLPLLRARSVRSRSSPAPR